MSNTTTRKITGTTYRSRKVGTSQVIYTQDGDRLGRVSPTRGTAADFGAKWVAAEDRNARFANLAAAAAWFDAQKGA